MNPSGKTGTRTRAKKANPRRASSKKAHPLSALAGIWKDRPDWKGKTSAQIVAELRRRATDAKRG